MNRLGRELEIPSGQRPWPRATGRRRRAISALSSELARIDVELADLATTCGNLRALAATELTAEDRTATSSAYQQILTVLQASGTGDARQGDLPGPRRRATAQTRRWHPRQAEVLVSRKIFTESEAGIFTLALKGAQSRQPPPSENERRIPLGLSLPATLVA